MARDDDLRAIWESIRQANEKAAEALHQNAIHQVKCDGRYEKIESRLAMLLGLAGGIAGSLGAGLATFCGWAIPRLFGG